jgi:hypothetical protein
MKYIVCIGLVLSTVLGACKTTGLSNHNGNNQQPKTYQVSGTITFTGDYCGGAHPSEEMLKQFRVPAPNIGKVLHIRSGVTNNLNSTILYTLVTDSLGQFSVNLPPGDYCMIDDFRKDNSFFQSLFDSDNHLSVNDQKCVEDWLNSCFYSFTVSNADITNIQLNIHRICFVPESVPCVSYTGPYPP